MKQIKRILALLGILLLTGVYIATIILALTDDPNSMNAFRASIYCTIIVPVLIWAYTFIYKLLKGNSNDSTTSFTEELPSEHVDSDIESDSKQ